MQQNKQTFAPVAVLLFLCLLWAADSLRFDLFPRSSGGAILPPLVGEAALLGFLSILAAIPAAIRKSHWPQKATLAQAMLVGLGLFVFPALLIEPGNSWITGYTRIALFSLTPLLTIVFDPYLGATEKMVQPAEFLAAIVAVAGTLLVFPMEVPHSTASFLAFSGVLAASASIAAANCLAVRACQPDAVSLFTFSGITAGFAACCLGGVSLVLGKTPAAAASLDLWAMLRLSSLALLFWLMKHMSAVRISTRFLITPLLANLAGLAFLRPHVPLQGWFGLGLIALGAGWLLFVPDQLPQENRNLLRLD